MTVDKDELGENMDTGYCLKLPDLPSNCMFDFDEQCQAIVKSWDTMNKCKRDLYENMTILEPSAMDKCHCYPPCRDIVYEASYSLATLPDQTEDSAFYFVVNNFLEEILHPDKRTLFKKKYGNDTYKNSVSAFVSRLNVHIADNNVIKTTEAPDYEAIRLVSDIGGQLGLWIGISVMTLFEVLQLIADVCRYLTRTGRRLGERKSQQKVADQSALARFPELEPEIVFEIDKLTAV